MKSVHHNIEIENIKTQFYLLNIKVETEDVSITAYIIF